MRKVVPSQIVEFIEARFPQTKMQPIKAFSCDHNSAGLLNTLLFLVDQLPSSLLPQDSRELIRFSEACQEIRSEIALWHSGTENAALHYLTHMRDGSGLNPVTALRDALLRCPDEPMETPEEDLRFLKDVDFRDTIRRDISSANQALSNAEWKASTVLAGSIVEALLLWVISKLKDAEPAEYVAAKDKSVSDLTLGQTLPRKPGGNPNGWTFDDYIHVAFAANLLSESTAKECLLAKNYRNLIHHGASERKKQKCDRGTALVAIAAMEHVIRELQSKSQ